MNGRSERGSSEVGEAPRAAALSTETALELIDQVYRAALAPSAWEEVAAAVGRAFGDAAVAVSLGLPGASAERVLYVHGLSAGFGQTHVSAARAAFPWSGEAVARLQRGFVDVGTLFPGIELRDSVYERDWMRPQGLPPVWPIAHLLLREGHVAAAMAVFRRGAGGPFGPEEIAFADLLVPHLGRAHRLFVSLGGARQERLAIGEVVDRLSQAIFLLDAGGRVAAMNRSARRILAANDGLALDGAVLRATDEAADAVLRERVAEAVGARRDGGALPRARGEGASLVLPRRSGRRALTAHVARLLDPAPGRPPSDLTAVVFAGDPETEVPAAWDVLRRAFRLTPAEAAIVQLLAQGQSLDEAARVRGVSRNTAKTLLGRVFAKTGTHRQSDLIRLVLTGVPEAAEP